MKNSPVIICCEDIERRHVIVFIYFYFHLLQFVNIQICLVQINFFFHWKILFFLLSTIDKNQKYIKVCKLLKLKKESIQFYEWDLCKFFFSWIIYLIEKSMYWMKGLALVGLFTIWCPMFEWLSLLLVFVLLANNYFINVIVQYCSYKKDFAKVMKFVGNLRIGWRSG